MNELSGHCQGDEYVEDCDCHHCALEFRNRYKAALAAVSAEMGLPPMMGPANGELRRLLDDGKAAIDLLRNAPKVISEAADFDALTWTFQIAQDCRVGAGTYALVWLRPNVK